MIEIEIKNQKLILFPEKGVFWRDKNALIVTDLHLGKDTAFRANGIPIPKGNTTATLNKLSELLKKTEPEKLIIMGDFMHAKESQTEVNMEELLNWRFSHSSVEMILVKGNHDRIAGDLPNELEITNLDEPYNEPPFRFCHEPETHDEFYTFCGHIHPAVSLKEPGKRKVRLPCFCFRENQALIPAFGEFTGTHLVEPREEDKIFVVTESELFEI